MTNKVNSSRSSSARVTGDAVSRRLRDYYDSVKEEGIPDRFLDLLERLDAVDGEAGRREKISAENASE